MKISYNWLKWYVPDAPKAEELADILTYHLAEVETVEKLPDGDYVLDVKILPNRAHDLLSHQGMAREVASLLNIPFVDHTPQYKIPESKPTELKVRIETDACKRYMGRVIRNIKIEKSPDWMVKHLESIGQRSINNIVDATNIVMFDCGEPTHVFDLEKIKGALIARPAKDGETVTTLDGKECKLTPADFVVSDEDKALIIGGVKGGKAAEVTASTNNIVLEVGNFDAVTVRKTSTRIGIRTEGSKRWENGVSPELASYGMMELSALIAEMCPEAIFEDVVDVYPAVDFSDAQNVRGESTSEKLTDRVYPEKQKERKLSFSVERIASILGLKVSSEEIENILKRYVFEYVYKKGVFEIIIPPMRLDLVIEEDMAEEIGRVIGYDKLKGEIPKINFKTQANETHAKISWARNKLLEGGYSEVMTYVFADKGEVSVLASASDKTFLRANLADGLKESIKLNKINSPLLGIKEIKVFEIGAVWSPEEEIHVAYNEGEKIIEKNLEEFYSPLEEYPKGEVDKSSTPAKATPQEGNKFTMWPLFPFIARDVAVWVPKEVASHQVHKVIKENAGDLVIKGPDLFDEFSKDDKKSYAFKLVFQSYDRTLTDAEINEIMEKITTKLKENPDWQVR